MKINKLYAIATMLGLLTFVLNKAQSQVLFFDGVGRAVLANQNINGERLKDDTSSIRQNTGGYTRFDLGVNVMPSKSFHINAVLRANQPFGLFFGNGSTLSFRQMQVKTVLAKALYLELGDIDVIQSPYTLYNNDEIYKAFESDIFSRRRDILNYENFNFGNQWRLQGAKSNIAFSTFKTWADTVKLETFATRTKPADGVTSPDRFLFGAKPQLINDSVFNLSANFTGFADNSVDADDYKYTNHVGTLEGSVNLLKRTFLLALEGHTGLSSYNFESRSQDSTVSFSDFFYDANLRLRNGKKYNVALGYREVGPQFTSPGAQTMRVIPSTNSSVFSLLEKNTTPRGQLLYDRATTESLYNRTISSTLTTLSPLYGNINPYGIATPNRRGLYLNADINNDTAKVITAQVGAALQNEIIGEGTTELRSFLTGFGGLKFTLSNQLDWEKNISFNIGGRYESTSRDGRASIDFNTLLLDLGTSVELVNDLSFLLGYKQISGKGQEFLSIRDGFNGISSFEDFNIESKESITAVGIQYEFKKNAVLSADYNMVKYTDEKTKNSAYDLNQLFVHFSMKF